MSHRQGVLWLNIHLTALALILFPGCASMSSTKEELKSLAENEGIVVGSVLLVVEKGDADESAWAFLRGRKAGELEYSALVSEIGFNPLKTTYSVPVDPAKEAVFIRKLPVGSYSIDSLGPSTFSASGLRWTLAISFTVKPRQTSYIGKLVVEIPDRINSGSAARVHILDAQAETIENLKGEHPSVVANTVKELATSRTIVGTSLPGKSTADPGLERDTLSGLMMFDRAADADCKERKVVNREIVSASSQKAEEHWFVNRCGKLVRYRITYQADPRGGTNIGWAPGEVVSESK